MSFFVEFVKSFSAEDWLCGGCGVTSRSRKTLRLNAVLREVCEGLHEMGKCCAPLCKNSSFNGAKMFPFPKDPKLRRRWYLAVGVSIRKLKGNELCWAHFEDGQWAKFGFELKPNAIPSIFKTCLQEYQRELMAKEFLDASSKDLNPKLSKLVGCRRSQPYLPCCLCFDRHLSVKSFEHKGQSDFVQCECLLQEYLMESNSEKKRKIVADGEEMNKILREEVARLKAKLIAYS